MKTQADYILEAMTPIIEAASKHKHKKKLHSTAIGGNLSYTVTPTSIGTLVTAKCSCGYELDNSGGL